MPPSPGDRTAPSGSPREAFLSAWLGAPDEAEQERIAAQLANIATQLGAAPEQAATRAEFWVELARCIPEGTDDAEVASALAAVHVGDLFVAFGSRRGDVATLARFEREYVAALDGAIARIDRSEGFVDEVKQRVRLKLLVADDGEPARLAHYTGRGALQAWLRVVAVREALSLLRTQRRGAVVADDELLALEAADSGPETSLLKQRWRAEFVAAFQGALGEIEPAERNLLRLHYLHGLSIDELGKLLGIHRSSAARRIVRTRESLLAATRRSLLLRVSVGRQEFDQLMALVASRLDLSIERFLAERDTHGAAP